jgi:hypothetical protein
MQPSVKGLVCDQELVAPMAHVVFGQVGVADRQRGRCSELTGWGEITHTRRSSHARVRAAIKYNGLRMKQPRAWWQSWPVALIGLLVVAGSVAPFLVPEKKPVFVEPDVEIYLKPVDGHGIRLTPPAPREPEPTLK